MLVNQSANSENLLLVSVNAAKLAKDGMKKEGTGLKNDFQSMMSQKVTAVKNTDKSEIRNVKSKAETQTNTAVENKERASDYEAQDTKVSIKHKDTENVSGENAEDNISDTDLENLEEDIYDVLSKQLGMTKEELEAKLSEMGIEIFALLNLDVLKDFFLTMQEVNAVDLITDEALAGQFTDIIQIVEQTKEAFGITPEVLDTLLARMEENLPDEAYVLQDGESEEANPNLMDDEMPVEAENENTNIIVKTENRGNAGETKSNEQNADSRANQTAVQTKVTEKADGTTEIKHMVLNQLNEAVGNTKTFTETVTHTLQARDIVNQLVEAIKITVRAENTSMEMQLYPAHLGKIQIQVVAKEGVMTAQITAETEAAKRAIEGGLANLKETFEKQNLKVDAVEVSVATAAFTGSEQKGSNFAEQERTKSGGKIHLNSLKDVDEEELSEAEKIENEMMKADGRSVNYTA